MTVSEVIFGPLLKVMGHTRLQLIVSAVLLFAFLGGMARTNQNTETMAIVVCCKQSLVYYLSLFHTQL